MNSSCFCSFVKIFTLSLYPTSHPSIHLIGIKHRPAKDHPRCANSISQSACRPSFLICSSLLEIYANVNLSLESRAELLLLPLASTYTITFLILSITGCCYWSTKWTVPMLTVIACLPCLGNRKCSFCSYPSFSGWLLSLLQLCCCLHPFEVRQKPIDSSWIAYPLEGL